MQEKIKRIAFTCAYTPLALIDAAGFIPYRILPMGNSPDHAGSILHDNICPHVKRILDRALDKDLPDLSGIVLMNSCEAMRRLTDAWKRVRPEDPVVFIDLPLTAEESSVSYLSQQLEQLGETLSKWSGHKITKEDINKSLERYVDLTKLIETVRNRIIRKTLMGGYAKMQNLYNQASTQPINQTIESLKQLAAKPEEQVPLNDAVSIFLFGNVLPDPEAFSLFENCGAHIISEDLCTGSRAFAPITANDSENIYTQIARGLLSRPACARTFDPAQPGKLAEDVLRNARAVNARGVIGHTVKFCDPYLARLPAVREVLKKEGIPFLLLEGDCTLRSMGQQRTRIEAFVEMLR